MEAPHPIRQEGPRHHAYSGGVQQLRQLLHRGTGRYAEEAHELPRDALGIEPVLAGLVVQVPHELAAEVVEVLGHSSRFFPVKRSYISTMKRLASRERGPLGLVPNLNSGSASTYWKARSI